MRIELRRCWRFGPARVSEVDPAVAVAIAPDVVLADAAQSPSGSFPASVLAAIAATGSSAVVTSTAVGDLPPQAAAPSASVISAIAALSASLIGWSFPSVLAPATRCVSELMKRR